MSWTFSQRAQKLTSSAIREILKVTERPEVISFAGGLPSPATFPVERLRAACADVLTQAPSPALQYGPTEGYLPLREWIAERYKVAVANVLVTTGSQQGLDLLGKVLIDVDSRVLVETPTYLGALQAFSLSEPQFVSVPSDDEGLVPDGLTRELTNGARLLYCLPNFQNPTGRRLPVARRRQLTRIASAAGLLLLEDDPYGALSYSGEQLPTLHSMNPDGVVHMGSFSKVLAPGLRVGYIIAPEVLLRKLVQAKQAADLHTPSFTQRIVHEVVKDGFLDEHIPKIRTLYGEQCRTMLDALQEYFPSSVSWNTPAGGMFIWVKLPEHVDSSALLEQAIAQNIAFVPGAPFFANEPQKNTLRLSFVTVPKEKIVDGIARLGQIITRMRIAMIEETGMNLKRWMVAGVALGFSLCAAATDVPADLAKAVKDYDEAQVHGNRAELERLVADDYTLVNSSGAIQSKAQLIADYTAPGYKIEPFVVREPIEKVWSDGAVMAGVATLKGIDGGKPFAVTLRFADIWAKRGGKWQVIYTHVSRPPAK